MFALLRKAAVALFVLVAACAAPVPRPEAVSRGDYATIRAYIAALAQREMRKANVTGLSVALVDDQNLVWAEGFGFADRARNTAAGADTVYRLGSITKLFTAAAIMQLAEEGRLAIDQPVAAAIPDFSVKSRFNNARPVTPRLLLSHHGGLPTDILKGFSEPRPSSLAELTRRLQDEYLAFPPGTVWCYSNVGYSLLGRIIETAAAAPYEAHIDGALLKPLGMSSSSISAKTPQGPAAAKGYREGKEADDLILRDVPAGGLNASVRDMGRFLSMIFADGRANGRDVLRAETVHEMLRPQNTDVPLDLNFRVGLGWMLSGLGDIDLSGAGPVAHHAGSTDLFHGQVIALPVHKLGVVVLGNSASAGKVVNKIAVEALKLALEAKTGIREPEPAPPTLSDRPLAPELVRAFEGDYATLLGYAKVYAKGGELRAEAVGRTFRLLPRDDGLLAIRYSLLGIVNIDLGMEVGLSRARIADREILVAQIGGQQLLAGEKIEPVGMPDAWLERLGEYEVTNLGDDRPVFTRVALARDARHLLLRVLTAQAPDVDYAFPLEALDDRVAVIRGLGQRQGDAIVATQTPSGVQLAYSGYLFKRKPSPESP
jgi:CubicO group peptidase (beta-lactamase class C family)